MNSTDNPEPRQRLRLYGICLGCKAKTIKRGVIAVRADNFPPGTAAWMCAKCADDACYSRGLQRRINVALDLGLMPGSFRASAYVGDPTGPMCFQTTPAFAAAYEAACAEGR